MPIGSARVTSTQLCTNLDTTWMPTGTLSQTLPAEWRPKDRETERKWWPADGEPEMRSGEGTVLERKELGG